MKVNVIKDFVDKHTGELHAKGSSFECDLTRFEEIRNAGEFVQVVEEKATEKAETKPQNKSNKKGK